MWCSFLFTCLLQLCAASRVLVMFPVPSRSHAALGDSIVTTLLVAGHEVTYISPYSMLKPHAALRHVDIGSVTEELTEKETLNLMELVRNPRPPHRVLEIGTSFAQRALQNDAVREMLLDPTLTFDLVLAEWFYSGLLAPLASLYECPLIWYSAMDISWMSLQLVHGHTNPAYSADPQARSMATGYALRERLERLRDQAYLTAWMYYMLYYVENSLYHEIYRTPFQLRARHPPGYEELVYDASLLLINSQPLTGQVLALPPNAKYVGGHHIEVPTKPLPETLQKLLDNAKNGAIYFSLGSNVKSKDLPEYIKKQLIDIFGQLEQTVIWKFEEPLENLPTNLHVVKWAPQTSILNHTNTILTISQGGFMSYMEAMYFGVPVIGIPIFGDQFLTMDLARARGHGIRVHFSDYLAYRLKDAINEVLGNYSYRSNAKKASVIFQNALVSPQKELLHWMELVMNHGANHLRSPAVRLSIIERLYIDVAVVIMMFLWFLSKVWKVIKVHWNSEEGAVKKNQ